MAVRWAMYSRSCELAYEVGATLWLSVGACIHVHVNLYRCNAVAVGWGMYSRSCELAHEVNATL